MPPPPLPFDQSQATLTFFPSSWAWSYRDLEAGRAAAGRNLRVRGVARRVEGHPRREPHRRCFVVLAIEPRHGFGARATATATAAAGAGLLPQGRQRGAEREDRISHVRAKSDSLFELLEDDEDQEHVRS